MHLTGMDEDDIAPLQLVKSVLHDVLMVAFDEHIQLQIAVDMQHMVLRSVHVFVVNEADGDAFSHHRDIPLDQKISLHGQPPYSSTISYDKSHINRNRFMLF